MSIQHLCYSGAGGGGGGEEESGSSLKPSQGLGNRGKEHSSQGNRGAKGQILRRRGTFGNREYKGNKGTGTILPP